MSKNENTRRSLVYLTKMQGANKSSCKAYLQQPILLDMRQHSIRTAPLSEEMNLGFLFTCSKHWMTSPIWKSSQSPITSPHSFPLPTVSTSCFSRLRETHDPSNITSPLLKSLMVEDLVTRPSITRQPAIFTSSPLDLLLPLSSNMFST